MISGKLSDSEKEIIKEMRDKGFGYRVIARALNCKSERVKDYCKANGLGGYKGANLKEEAFDRFVNGFNSRHGDRFEYVSGFVNSEERIIIKCKACGTECERSAQVARKDKRLSCDECKRQGRKNEEIKLLRELILKRSINISSSLTEIEIVECLECRSLTANNKGGYCSVKCKKKKYNRTKELRRNKRLKENGEVDHSITLPRVIEREGNACYICGEQCDSNDYTIDSEGNYITGKNHPSIEHIIPVSKGGTHTWDNIKLAHMHCNSRKSNKDTEINTGQLTLTL